MIQRSLGHSSIQIYPNPLHTYWLIPIRSCSIPFILDLLCQILSLLFETLPLFSASGLPTLPWERLTRTSSTILDKHKNELNNTIRSWYFYVFLCSVREARDRAIWTSTAMVTWPGKPRIQHVKLSDCRIATERKCSLDLKILRLRRGTFLKPRSQETWSRANVCGLQTTSSPDLASNSNLLSQQQGLLRNSSRHKPLEVFGQSFHLFQCVSMRFNWSNSIGNWGCHFARVIATLIRRQSRTKPVAFSTFDLTAELRNPFLQVIMISTVRLWLCLSS